MSKKSVRVEPPPNTSACFVPIARRNVMSALGVFETALLGDPSSRLAAWPTSRRNWTVASMPGIGKLVSA